jgi:hypothetical protein
MKLTDTPNKEPKWMRRIRTSLGFFAALCVIYPTIIVLIQFDDYYMFPNGAVLDRVFDWEKWSRIDLLRSWDGELLVHDVDLVCFDRKAIKGTSQASGYFVWLGGNALPIPGSDAAYDDAVRESGLNGEDGRCVGYFGRSLGAKTLLFDPQFAWRRAKPDQKPRSGIR